MATLKINKVLVVGVGCFIFEVGKHAYLDNAHPIVKSIHLHEDNMYSVDCEDGSVIEIIECSVIVTNGPNVKS
jgi:hypothetical protein